MAVPGTNIRIRLPGDPPVTSRCPFPGAPGCATVNTGWFTSQPGPSNLNQNVNPRLLREPMPIQLPSVTPGSFEGRQDPEQGYLSTASSPFYTGGGRYDEDYYNKVRGQDVSRSAPQMTWYVSEQYGPTSPATSSVAAETKAQSSSQQYYTSSPQSQAPEQTQQAVSSEQVSVAGSGFDWKILLAVAVGAYFLLKKKQ